MTGSVRNPLHDPTAVRLEAGNLEAVFLPGHGMLGISLRHRGAEILRRLDDLEEAAAHNRVAGLPLLFPWANRLAGFHYEAAGRAVTLPRNAPLLRYDDNGLPMHGLPWPHLAWTVVEKSADRLTATFDWSSEACLALFPYPCRLTMTPALDARGLTIETAIKAGSDGPVPVSFGFHPYIGIPDLPRAKWRANLPAMRHLTLDAEEIPTGAEAPFPGLDADIGGHVFDDGFALLGDTATFSIAGAGRRISVDLLENYPNAQVFMPKGKDYVAFEPMTAPTNALISGKGLPLVAPNDAFSAVFRIRIESED